MGTGLLSSPAVMHTCTGFPELLEEKGWETELNESKHSWAAKIWRW